MALSLRSVFSSLRRGAFDQECEPLEVTFRFSFGLNLSSAKVDPLFTSLITEASLHLIILKLAGWGAGESLGHEGALVNS